MSDFTEHDLKMFEGWSDTFRRLVTEVRRLRAHHAADSMAWGLSEGEAAKGCTVCGGAMESAATVTARMVDAISDAAQEG